MFVIRTQYMENYGVHDWDGEGSCPQRWKYKGGSEYKITGVNPESDPQDLISLADVEFDDMGAREYVVSSSFEQDDYLSDFERSQMAHDGEIIFPEPHLTWDEMEAQVMGISTEMVWNRKAQVEEMV